MTLQGERGQASIINSALDVWRRAVDAQKRSDGRAADPTCPSQYESGSAEHLHHLLTGVNAGASLTYSAASAASKAARRDDRRLVSASDAIVATSILPRPLWPIVAFRCRSTSCAALVFSEKRRQGDAEHLCASTPAVAADTAASSVPAAWRSDDPENEPDVLAMLAKVRAGIAPLTPQQQRIERRLALGRRKLSDKAHFEPLGEMYSAGHVFTLILSDPTARGELLRGDWDAERGVDMPVFPAAGLKSAVVVSSIAEALVERKIDLGSEQHTHLGYTVTRRLKAGASASTKALVASQAAAQIALQLSLSPATSALFDAFEALDEDLFVFRAWDGGRQPDGAHVTKVRPCGTRTLTPAGRSDQGIRRRCRGRFGRPGQEGAQESVTVLIVAMYIMSILQIRPRLRAPAHVAARSRRRGRSAAADRLRPS